MVLDREKVSVVSAVSVSALNGGIGSSIGISLKCGIGTSLLISTKSFAYKTSFIKPSSAFSVTTSTTIANNKGNKADL